MQLLVRYRLEILAFCLIVLFFFVTRLVALLAIPMFTDEAIYLRWAQIAKQDAAWRFISLTDGKQPFFIWLVMVAMRFVQDPLLAGRLVSVGAGLGSLIGLFFLGRELFRNHWVGIISTSLYALYPFALVYDRMALYDGLVGTFAIWSLFLAVLLARRIQLDLSLLLGMVLGGGVLNKSIGFLSIYLLPLSLFLFDWRGGKRRRRFLKWCFFMLVSVVLAYSFYSILRLSPFFHIIKQKDALFVYPLNEWLAHPFEFFWGNLWIGQRDWLLRYMKIPVLVLVVASFFIRREFLREKVLLVLWFAVPFAALALFGKTLYPRFTFFMTLSLIPLAGFSLYWIQKSLKRFHFFFASFLILFSWFRTDYLILTNFERSGIPKADIHQYLTDWPAGGGIKEAVAFFEEEGRKGKLVIGTQGTFGLMPYSLEIYLVKNPNVRIVGFWPIEETVPQELTEASRRMPTYVIFYQPCKECPKVGEAPKSWKVTVVWQYKKMGDEKYLTIYRVNP